MDRKTWIVAIEGVDLVGKTTLAKRIARDFGWTYFYTPAEPFASIRKRIEGMRDLASRFFYYLSCVVGAQPELKTSAATQSVIIDRYIYSTFVMHEALGFDTSCVSKSALPILYPDVTIVLTAEKEERRVRKIKRGDGTTPDSAIEQQEGILEIAQKRFSSLPNVRLIDTTKLSAEQVYAQALAILREEGIVCLPHSASLSEKDS